MSSTNRGGVRVEGDFYETPAWCVEAIVPHLPAAHSAFDPAAGTGAILRALRPHFGIVAGIELDAHRASAADPALCIKQGDGLKGWAWGSQPLVVMNPPYSLALEFVCCALSLARQGGTVAALLRLAFLESRERSKFNTEHPADVFVMTGRPSFCANVRCKSSACVWAIMIAPDAPRPKSCPTCGSKVSVTTSDSCAYAWFVWGPGRGGRWSILEAP